jgi:hypothetical protein
MTVYLFSFSLFWVFYFLIVLFPIHPFSFLFLCPPMFYTDRVGQSGQRNLLLETDWWALGLVAGEFLGLETYSHPFSRIDSLGIDFSPLGSNRLFCHHQTLDRFLFGHCWMRFAAPIVSTRVAQLTANGQFAQRGK